jgi:CBS domain-containing protein
MRCPSCGFDNIQGTDRCETCMKPLFDLDVPQPGEGLQGHIMLDSVKELTVFNSATVSPNDTAQRAIEAMREHSAGCALVMDAGLAGILSEVDLLFRMPVDADPSRINVSQLMTPNPETVDEEATMAAALHLMSIGGYRHLPVIARDHTIGILSIKDLLHYLNRHLEALSSSK